MSTYGATSLWGPIRSASPAVPAGDQDVRLTRRGRLARTAALVLALGLLALSLVNTLGARSAQAGTSPSTRVATTSVTVSQGDSLWGIAQAAYPTTDPREVVLAIRELNAMRSNLIHPGEALLIPDMG